MSAPNTLRSFWFKRLHSLFGVIPLGAFLLEHMLTNSLASEGAAKFNDAVWTLQRLPYLVVLELGFIALPLAYHTIYGTYFALTSRPTIQDYPFGRNLLYTLQRLSGLIAAVFILFHVASTRFSFDPSATTDFYSKMAAHLGSPAMKAIYLTGIIATVYHFANGLGTFLMTWGITESKKSQQVASLLGAGVGAALALMGFRAVFAF